MVVLSMFIPKSRLTMSLIQLAWEKCSLFCCYEVQWQSLATIYCTYLWKVIKMISRESARAVG